VTYSLSPVSGFEVSRNLENWGSIKFRLVVNKTELEIRHFTAPVTTSELCCSQQDIRYGI